MKDLKKFICSLDRVERIGLVLLIVSFAAAGLATVGYLLFGHSLIESMYNGQSLPFLNQLIQYQETKPLEHYLDLADAAFEVLIFRGLYIEVVVLIILYFFYKISFTEKSIHPVFPIVVFVLFVSLPYVLNPNYRILSAHGFYRVGISYQIMNGSIPPNDPLFAGDVQHAPWGYPCLIAMLSYLLQISPFKIVVLINLFCLAISMYLIYKISLSLFGQPKIAVFSMIITFFAFSPVTKFMVLWIGSVIDSYHPFAVGTPIGPKFQSTNGVPLGCVFFLLFLECLLQYFRTPKVRYLGGLLLAVAGCGFFYFPMFPGFIVSLMFVLLINFITFRKNFISPHYKHSFYLLSITIAGGLITLPYYLVIRSGAVSEAEFFTLPYVLNNIATYCIFVTPLAILIFIFRRQLLLSIHKTDLHILLMIIAATSIIYFLTHLQNSAEYKFYLLPQIVIGILGGFAFGCLQKKIHLGTFLLLLLFCLPFTERIWMGIHRYGNRPLFFFLSPSFFHEKGTRLYPTEPESKKLYDWILDNTSKDSIFIDSTLTIPVLGQRGLYVGFDPVEDKPAAGYGCTMDFFQIHHGYDLQEYNRRKRLVQSLYGRSDEMSPKAVREALKNLDCYIVVRKKEVPEAVELPNEWEIYATPQGTITVYRPPGNQ